MKNILMKYLLITAALILIITFFPVYSFAQTTVAPVSVGVSAISNFIVASKSSSINITIDSSASTRAMEFSLIYDPRLIQIDKVEEADFYGKWAAAHNASTAVMPGKIDNQAGILTCEGIAILGAPHEGVRGSGNLFTIRYTALSGVNGISDLVLSGVKFMDAESKVTGVTKTDEQVEVTGGRQSVPHKDLKSNAKEPYYMPTIPPTNPIPPSPVYPNREPSTKAGEPNNTGSISISPPRSSPAFQIPGSSQSDFSLPDPLAPPAWGTDIIELPVYGVMATQRYSTTLNLTNSGDWLFAPVCKGVNGCPIEVVTTYSLDDPDYIPPTGLLRCLRIYDWSMPPSQRWIQNKVKSFDQSFRDSYGTLGSHDGVPAMGQANHYQFYICWIFPTGQRGNLSSIWLMFSTEYTIANILFQPVSIKATTMIVPGFSIFRILFGTVLLMSRI